MSEADASAKLILFGEHAVVYGRPALAIPLPTLRAHVWIRVNDRGEAGHIEIESEHFGASKWLHESSPDDPLAAIVKLSLDELHLTPSEPLLITIHSDIPVGAGLGSGASVSIAIARALARFAGADLTPETASRLAFAVERIHHGSPSGIDNTVIAFEQPVYYIRDRVLQPFTLNSRLHLILADSGARTQTSMAVAGVRSRYQTDPQTYEGYFDQIGQLTDQAYALLQSGDDEPLGGLMTRNHALLRSLGVSSPELDALVDAAIQAGAQGAKLSGAGMGGYMAALVTDALAGHIRRALEQAGGSGLLEVEVGK
ncbi:MAG: mevalonate kinase [Anaerolineales bacterium]